MTQASVFYFRGINFKEIIEQEIIVNNAIARIDLKI